MTDRRVEALLWIADELDAKIEEIQQDWVKVLLTASARGRIRVLTEMSAMCRKAAARVERGGQLEGRK